MNPAAVRALTTLAGVIAMALAFLVEVPPHVESALVGAGMAALAAVNIRRAGDTAPPKRAKANQWTPDRRDL